MLVPTNFLSGFESKLIARDWEQLIKSAVACTVTIKSYDRTGSTLDPVFNVQAGGTLTMTTVDNVKVIQEIVTQFRKDMLQWGQIGVGDSVFYFSSEITNIPNADIIEFRIITDGGSGNTWVANPQVSLQAYEFLRLRLGPVSTKIGRIVVAKLES